MYYKDPKYGYDMKPIYVIQFSPIRNIVFHVIWKPIGSQSVTRTTIIPMVRGGWTRLGPTMSDIKQYYRYNTFINGYSKYGIRTTKEHLKYKNKLDD